MTGVTADVPQALVLLSLRQGQLHTPGLEITDLKGASCRWAVSLCRAVNNCLASDSTGQLPMPGDICHCSGFHSQQEVHCMVDASRAEAGVNLTQDFYWAAFISPMAGPRQVRKGPPLALVLHVAMNCQVQTTASLRGGSLPNPDVSVT